MKPVSTSSAVIVFIFPLPFLICGVHIYAYIRPRAWHVRNSKAAHSCICHSSHTAFPFLTHEYVIVLHGLITSLRDRRQFCKDYHSSTSLKAHEVRPHPSFSDTDFGGFVCGWILKVWYPIIWTIQHKGNHHFIKFRFLRFFYITCFVWKYGWFNFENVISATITSDSQLRSWNGIVCSIVIFVLEKN